MKYIASCSFGKDSLATIILAHLHGEPLDEILYVEVMFDEGIDVTLDSERELKENINVAVDFACRQLMASQPPTVGSRQEGYGIAAQYFGAVNRAMDGLKAGMKQYLAILGATDADAVNAASSLHNEAVDLVEQAIGMAAQMNRVMNDLYTIAASQKTPIEEMLEEDDGFEEAEEGPQDDEPEEEEE